MLLHIKKMHSSVLLSSYALRKGKYVPLNYQEVAEQTLLGRKDFRACLNLEIHLGKHCSDDWTPKHSLSQSSA